MQENQTGLARCKSFAGQDFGLGFALFYQLADFFVIQTKKVASNAADSGEGYQKQQFKPTTKQHQQQQFKANRKEEDGI